MVRNVSVKSKYSCQIGTFNESRNCAFFQNEHCVGCTTATYLRQKFKNLILNKEVMIKIMNYHCYYDAVVNISLSMIIWKIRRY